MFIFKDYIYISISPSTRFIILCKECKRQFICHQTPRAVTSASNGQD